MNMRDDLKRLLNCTEPIKMISPEGGAAFDKCGGGCGLHIMPGTGMCAECRNRKPKVGEFTRDGRLVRIEEKSWGKLYVFENMHAGHTFINEDCLRPMMTPDEFRGLKEAVHESMRKFYDEHPNLC